MKNLNMRGDNNNKIMEFQGHGGIKHFGNSEGKGGLRGDGSRLWCGMNIFWNHPLLIFPPWLISQGSGHYNYSQSNYYKMTITSQLVNNTSKRLCHKNEIMHSKYIICEDHSLKYLKTEASLILPILMTEIRDLKIQQRRWQ